MKLQIISLFALAVISCGTAQAQAGDAGIVAAIKIGDSQLSGQLKDNLKEHRKIAATEAAINAQLMTIREYEERTYKYLSTVNGAIMSAHEIVRCGKLVESIISNLGKCTKAAANHPDGAVVTGLVSDQYSEIITESGALAGYISSLVKKGGERNLLNSAERNQVLANVTIRLSGINHRLVRLRYQIELARWTHVLPAEKLDWAQMAKSERAFELAKKNIETFGKLL